mgnify:CR=1 FL=1
MAFPAANYPTVYANGEATARGAVIRSNSPVTISPVDSSSVARIPSSSSDCGLVLTDSRMAPLARHAHALLLVHEGSAFAFRSLTNTLWLILAAVVTMYIVLGVLYESWIHPITILSTLPSAGIGAVLALLAAALSVGAAALSLLWFNRIL